MKRVYASYLRQAAAITLSLCILLQIPANAAVTGAPAEQVRSSSFRVPRMNFSIDGQLSRNLAVPVRISVESLPQSLDTTPLVVGQINELLTHGVDLTGNLPEWKNAAALAAIAEKLPAGSPMQRNLKVLMETSNAMPDGTAQPKGFSQFFDNGNPPTAADAAPIVNSFHFRFWNAMSKIPLMPSSLKQKFIQRAEKAFGAANPAAYELKADQVRWTPGVDKLILPDSAASLTGNPVVGQDRALEAIRFGLQMKTNNHHLFLAGPDRSGRKTALKYELDKIASTQPAPPDRILYSSFKSADAPILEVPHGSANDIQEGILSTIYKARMVLPVVIEKTKQSKYQEFYNSAAQQLQKIQDQLNTAGVKVGRFDIGLELISTEKGPIIEVLPALDGVILTAELQNEKLRDQHSPQRVTKAELEQFKREAHSAVESAVQLKQIQKSLTQFFAAFVQEDLPNAYSQATLEFFLESLSPYEKKVTGDKLKPCDEELKAMGLRLKEKLKAIQEQQGATAETRADLSQKAQEEAEEEAKAIVEKYKGLLSKEETTVTALFSLFAQEAASTYGNFLPAPKGVKAVDPTELFKTSVLASSKSSGAPVIDGSQRPTYEELFGQLILKDEKEPGPNTIGIKTGLLHQANGGFIYLDAMHVLMTPGMYGTLLEAVETGQARISAPPTRTPDGKINPAQGPSLRLPWKGKVILVGSPNILALLKMHDPLFAKHFQATAEFASRLDINDQNIGGVKGFLRRMLDSGKLSEGLAAPVTSIHASATAAILELASRMAESNTKITARLGALLTSLQEAAFWAQSAGRQEMLREDVEKAVDAKRKREGLSQDRMRDMYVRDVFHVQTEGEAIGQVNALTIYGEDFGLPARATVVMYPNNGQAGVADSDDIIGWAGPSYKAGVQNVANFILSVFGMGNSGASQTFPARLTTKKEQLYGGIDGDSSTSSKMYASLSRIAGVPVKQTVAITGSADQFGNVQPIGGVNDKIEGFYDVVTQKLELQGKTLDGSHGVIIPASNVDNLQLRRDVAQAVKDGKFHIWAVRHVGQGMEILAGMSYKKILYLGNKVLAAMRKALGNS